MPNEKLSRQVAASKRPPRSGAYLAYIRTLPCLVCGGKAEAAHTGPHGMGTKASDFDAVPLCAEHHRTGKDALDGPTNKTWWADHGMDHKLVLRTLRNCYWNNEGDPEGATKLATFCIHAGVSIYGRTVTPAGENGTKAEHEAMIHTPHGDGWQRSK